MLAMVVNDYSGSLTLRGVLSTIASMLAPTGMDEQHSIGTIRRLIGQDPSHGAIVRLWGREQTCSISAAPALPVRTTA